MTIHEDNFGLKELERVTLRAYSDMKIGNRKYSEGEPVIYFDRIQISQLNEQKRTVAARGGFKNLPLVVWTDFYGLDFTFSNGLISEAGLGLLSDSGALKHEERETTLKVNKKEKLMVVNGHVRLSESPLEQKIFAYALNEKGSIDEKIDITVLDKKIHVDNEYNGRQVLVDYYYIYNQKNTEFHISDEEIDGYFTVEGYTNIKDEATGQLKTFFFEIPKAKITSYLDITMGVKASPTVSVFGVTGLPVEEEGKSIVCKMHILDTDIMGDF